MKTKKLLARFAFALLTLAAPALPACTADVADLQESASAVGNKGGRGAAEAHGRGRPFELVERFPAREQVNSAMENYSRNGEGARAEPPVSVPEFFGKHVSSANIDKLRIERLKPEGRYEGRPIAFLNAHFHGTDMYWNNRYKDVQVYRLFDAIGIKDVFPEAKHVAHEGRALVRIWTDYTPISRGAPEGLTGHPLAVELARILVCSYVAGNADGPAHNANNGGFARVLDVAGRETWRGVLIDNGAAWNNPGQAQQPWRTNVLDLGPVTREQIPTEVVDGLRRMAEATRTELAEISRFDKIDDGARGIVEGQRARAREVLDHYGISYKTQATP
jgi:hypothetical protein